MDIAGPSSNAAALLLASQLNSAPAGGSDHGTAAETAALTIPRAHSLPMGLTTARPRKSKKFRYSAALKQIRQAEVCRDDGGGDFFTLPSVTIIPYYHYYGGVTQPLLYNTSPQ